MKVILFAALFLGMASFAEAQTAISVDLDKAALIWTASAGGTPDTYHVKCGSQTGVYTRITDVAAPTMTLAVKNAITGAGNYFCVVSASNQFGESGNSNEVPFVAGAVPSAPTNFRVQAQ